MIGDATNDLPGEFCFFGDNDGPGLKIAENFFVTGRKADVVVFQPGFGVVKFEADSVGGIVFFATEPGEVGYQITEYDFWGCSEVGGLDSKKFGVRCTGVGGDEAKIVTEAFLHGVPGGLGAMKEREFKVRDGGQGCCSMPGLQRGEGVCVHVPFQVFSPSYLFFMSVFRLS